MKALYLWLALVVLGVTAAATAPPGGTLASRNAALFEQLRQVHQLSDAELDSLKAIFARSGYVGQGNPAITRHPVSVAQCQARLDSLGLTYDNPTFAGVCGDRYMAPLYDPLTQEPGQARTCIDQFEFPNIPCAYPVVWVRAREAAQICAAMGKRLCDAHEWEGACDGQLEPPDYRFDLAAGQAPDMAVRRMKVAHNQAHAADRSWAYGPERRTGVCGGASEKTAGCPGGDWTRCGSNTYPDGYFPDCRSALEVYDQHGNAAEHMNLPLNESQMASRGSRELGYTEMKGSWFIFDKVYAHEDWCRWRAPYWHGSRVMDPHSHHNYHLGFRCCKDVVAETSAAPATGAAPAAASASAARR
ncbi:MAG: SUMF1/EgtB/PvdO family nonheme iron enzyme [Gemmatimonadota bacterium]